MSAWDGDAAYFERIRWSVTGGLPPEDCGGRPLLPVVVAVLDGNATWSDLLYSLGVTEPEAHWLFPYGLHPDYEEPMCDEDELAHIAGYESHASMMRCEARRFARAEARRDLSRLPLFAYSRA